MAKVKQDKLLTSIPPDHALVRMTESLFEWQRLVLQEPSRYTAVLAHRGCGKTALITMMTSLYALSMPRVEERILQPNRYIMILGAEKGETIKQYATQLEIALEGLIIERQLDPRSSIAYVKLINGNEIRIDGLNEVTKAEEADAESLRGKSVDMMVIDEIGIIEIQKALAALLPTLTRPFTTGSLTVFGTPKSEQSSFFKFWNETIPDLGGKRFFIPITHELSPFSKEVKAELEATYRRQQSTWNNEYLLNFKTNDQASVYGEVIDQMEHDGRIIPDSDVNFGNPTFVALDLGFNDDTALILYQVDLDGNPVIIDYYVNNRQPIDTYLEWIANKSQTFKVKYVYLPHDSNAQVIGRANTVASQFTQALRPLGIGVAILKKATKVAYELPIVKNTLNKATVLSKCKPMLDTLREYSYEKSNVVEGAYTDIPASRQNDHVADAVRYFAMAYHSRYATLTAEAKMDLANKGLMNSDYHLTREAMAQQIAKKLNLANNPIDTFRVRKPIRIGRR